MKKDWNDINIELIIAKNEQEISKLYDLLINWLMFIAKKDEELANDIFMKILAKISHYDENKGRLHNLIYTIGLNALRSHLRLKNSKQPKIEFHDYISFNQIIIFNESDIESDPRLDILNQSLNVGEKEYLMQYLENPEKKTSQQKMQFKRLKEQIKTKINKNA